MARTSQRCDDLAVRREVTYFTVWFVPPGPETVSRLLAPNSGGHSGTRLHSIR